MVSFFFFHLYVHVRIYSACASDAQPTDEEREIWNQVNSVLQDSESILLGLQAYKGAGQEIRDVSEHMHTCARTHTRLVAKAL